MKIHRNIIAAILCAGLCATPLLAGPSPERQALFQQVLKNPSDRSLMMQYARQAVKERDFEVAASTLERLIDLEPASVEARMELATAYYALGANESATYHFNILRQSDALSPSQRDLVEQYIEQAVERESTSSLTGFAQAGITYDGEERKSGPDVTLGLRHRLDLGDANSTALITTVRANYIDFGSNSTAGQRSIALTFGPAFRLTRDNFGPMLRPYLSVRSIKDDKPIDERDMLGIGLSAEAPISAEWSAFTNIEAGRVRYDKFNERGDYADGQIGVIWFPNRDLRIRASAIGRNVDVDEPAIKSMFRAVRVDFSRTLKPDFAKDEWQISGFVQAENEEFETGRKDDIRRIGAALKAYVSRDWYVNGELQYFDRTSTVAGFDDKEPLISFSVGMEF